MRNQRRGSRSTPSMKPRPFASLKIAILFSANMIVRVRGPDASACNTDLCANEHDSTRLVRNSEFWLLAKVC